MISLLRFRVRPGRLPLAALAVLALAVGPAGPARAQTVELYENVGSTEYQTYPPVVDARAFVNNGNFVIRSFLPFDTLNTINFTNRGLIGGTVGIDFLHLGPNGKRSWADNFVNISRGEIRVGTGSLFPFSIGNPGLDLTPSTLRILATNVVNRGLLQVAAPGLIRIHGKNVDLANGGLEIAPIEGRGSVNDPPFDFTPDVGIGDLYWGGVTNLLSDTSEMLSVVGDTVLTGTPNHWTTNTFTEAIERFSLAAPHSFAISNSFSETNHVVQAVFALVPDGMDVEARFITAETPLPERYTAMVEIATSIRNAVTGEDDSYTLYLTDELAWSTNQFLLPNAAGGGFRPAPYNVARIDLEGLWLLGRPHDLDLTIGPELFYNTTYSNTTSTNLYAAYSAEVSNDLASPIVLENAGGVDSLVGRIEIEAERLDLSNTRFRGEGLVSVKTDHLVEFSGDRQAPVMDGLNFDFRLANTNGVLDFRNLGRRTTQRFQGAVKMFSMSWTNQYGVDPPTEPPPDPPDPTEPVEPGEPETVVHEVFHHVLLVDARYLTTEDIPVYTHDLHLSGETVVVRDDLEIVSSFRSDARELTLEGDLVFAEHPEFSDRIYRLGAENFPRLRRLTVGGSLEVADTIDLGTGDSGPLESFINRGSVTAFSLNLVADRWEHAGFLQGSALVKIRAGQAKFDECVVISGNRLELEGTDYKFRNAELNVANKLVIDIAGTLTDAGPGSENTFEVGGGLELVRPAAGGDLLGTTVILSVPRFAREILLWSAEDRGAAAVGYVDNTAVGRLVVNAPDDGRLLIAPAGAAAAIYVDYLELVGDMAEDWDRLLRVEEGMTLYFAYSNVPVEELDGGLDGRLQWVSSFSGPNSSFEYLHPETGESVRVNRGLAESLTIDSDGDGTANGLDLTPFGGLGDPGTGDEIERRRLKLAVALSEAAVGERMVRLSWEAAAGRSYRVEYRERFPEGQWLRLDEVDNAAEERRTVTVTDRIAGDSTVRFYRLISQPR